MLKHITTSTLEMLRDAEDATEVETELAREALAMATEAIERLERITGWGNYLRNNTLQTNPGSCYPDDARLRRGISAESGSEAHRD